MNKILTLAEMQTRFASEWVLVGDPRADENLEVQTGVVLFHSKDREEVYRKAVELRPKRFAMLFTGAIPEDTAIIL